MEINNLVDHDKEEKKYNEKIARRMSRMVFDNEKEELFDKIKQFEQKLIIQTSKDRLKNSEQMKGSETTKDSPKDGPKESPKEKEIKKKKKSRTEKKKSFIEKSAATLKKILTPKSQVPPLTISSSSNEKNDSQQENENLLFRRKEKEYSPSNEFLHEMKENEKKKNVIVKTQFEMVDDEILTTEHQYVHNLDFIIQVRITNKIK